MYSPEMAREGGVMTGLDSLSSFFLSLQLQESFAHFESLKGMGMEVRRKTENVFLNPFLSKCLVCDNSAQIGNF